MWPYPVAGKATPGECRKRNAAYSNRRFELVFLHLQNMTSRALLMNGLSSMHYIYDQTASLIEDRTD